MKLVLDPKINDVQFIIMISQLYNGMTRTLALCAASYFRTPYLIPVFETEL